MAYVHRVQAGLLILGSLLPGPSVMAEPIAYVIDPTHTYPSVAVEHLGISWMRGKFNKSSGRFVIDREAGTGSVDVRIDPASIDFGHDGFNKKLLGEQFLNVQTHPEIRFSADAIQFENGVPVEVVGTMYLLGESGPLKLRVERFSCRIHPLHKREVCGIDAQGQFDRRAFGWDHLSKAHGGAVRLDIQLEGLRAP